MSQARRLVSGSALRVMTLVANVAVSFYMMPFLVRVLGDRWYGVWVIAGSVVGYYSILDLGLTVAAHRFLAMASSHSDRREASRVFTTALALFGAGGGIAAALIGLTWVVLPRFVAPGDYETARALIVLLGANFVIGFPVSVFHGVIAANLRYDLSSYLQFGKLIVRSIAAVIALQYSPSVVTLAWITLFTEVGGNAATAFVAVRLWPWLSVSRELFDAARVREFLHYGVYAFLIRVGDLVRYGLDNVVVGAFLGAATVTHYAIAMRLTDSFQDVLVNALGGLNPVFSRYHGLNDRESMFLRVRQASRLSVAVSGSLAGASVIFGAPFIARWMGPRFVDAYLPLTVLVYAALISVMQLPSTTYLLAIARHRYFAALNGADAIANLILSLSLAPRFGMLGVALGTAIPASLVKLVLQPRYVCAQLGYPFAAYWRELGSVLIRTLLIQVPIAIIVALVQPRSFFSIGGLAIVLYSVHAAVLYLFLLSEDDQLVLAGAVPPLASLLAVRRRAGLVFRGSL